MEALGLLIVAALFGYFATLVVRRHEVLRSIAVEVDRELREALNEAMREDADHKVLNAVNERLIAADLHAASLPERQRGRVAGQIQVAQRVTSYMFDYFDDGRVHVQLFVQPPIVAAREVVGPLLLPPPFLYRAPGRPRSYVDPDTFIAALRGAEGTAEVLDRLGELRGRARA